MGEQITTKDGVADVENKETQIVRCECGNVICVRDPADGTITVKKQGRIIEIYGADSTEITCEKCNRKTIFKGENGK